MIGGRDEDGVSKFWAVKNVLPRCDCVLEVKAMGANCVLTFVIDWFSDADDFEVVWDSGLE